jgi:hypothetical protein
MFKNFALILIVGLFTNCESDITCEINCNQKPDAGYCEALIKRYYYDKTEGKCKEFIWGGCDGTVPFETLNECISCRCVL